MPFRDWLISEVKKFYTRGIWPDKVKKYVIPYITAIEAQEIELKLKQELKKAIEGKPDEAIQPNFIDTHGETIKDAIKRQQEIILSHQNVNVLTPEATYDFLYSVDALSIHANVLLGIPTKGEILWKSVVETLKEKGKEASDWMDALKTGVKWGIAGALIYGGYKVIQAIKSKD